MRRALFLAIALLAPREAFAVDYVNDPLTDPSFAGRGGARGGSFSTDGWTTGGDEDSVWYEIPDALESGTVEYTVRGLSLEMSLTGNDHDLLTLYQAPDGYAEPVAYLPGFRNNDFKAFTRIFGAMETGRPGAMKLELAMCPEGPPWYHDGCDPSCGQGAIAPARGGQNDVGWDAATEYRMVLSWSPGQMTYSRNMEVLGTVNYTGTYSPQPLRVRIGSPRHGTYPTAVMPHGLTFKDVHIFGTPGARTRYCGQPEDPDAGLPEPDAGMSFPSMDLSVLEDVTAASWEPGVYSDPGDLNAEAGPDGSPAAVVYLKFGIGPRIARATLRMHTQSIPSAAGGSGQVCAVSTDMWSESTLTWANRPALGACVGLSRPVDPDNEVAWDVTSLLPPSGNVNLAIVSADADGVHYLSKESGAIDTWPRLSVEMAPFVPDAGEDAGFPDASVPDVSINADAAGPGGDAGARDASIAGDAGPGGADGGSGGASSSCSCEDARGDTAGYGALFGIFAFLALISLSVRRGRGG